MAAVNSMGPFVLDGSRTVPIGTAKMQVNDSVDLGGHNKNRSGVIAGPGMSRLQPVGNALPIYNPLP